MGLFVCLNRKLATIWRTRQWQMPVRHINDAAKIAQPGDEVWVAPGVYREYVDHVHAG